MSRYYTIIMILTVHQVNVKWNKCQLISVDTLVHYWYLSIMKQFKWIPTWYGTGYPCWIATNSSYMTTDPLGEFRGLGYPLCPKLWFGSHASRPISQGYSIMPYTFRSSRLCSILPLTSGVWWSLNLPATHLSRSTELHLEFVYL